MKKIFVASIVTGMLLGLGTVAAQSAASHDVVISIPDLLMIRLVDGDTASVVDPVVEFDFQTVDGIDLYLAAVDDGSALEPTASTFSDVIVFSNRAAWSVTVGATPFDYLDNLAGGFVAGGLLLSDVSVVPLAVAGETPFVDTRAASWDLTTATAIATGIRTQGWRSLGFGGDDYLLSVDGDENPGQYTTTVTYTIAAP